MENQSNKGPIITIVIVVVIIVLALIFWKGSSDQATVVNNSNTTSTATTTDDIATSTATTTNTTSTGISITASTSVSVGTPKTHTVTLTDAGYTPKSITINKGDSVKFVNQSNDEMWTASAQHPDHTVYPEKTTKDCLGSAFDQCTATGKGTSWTFKFNTVGSWNYHNHKNSSQFGTVVVK